MRIIKNGEGVTTKTREVDRIEGRYERRGKQERSCSSVVVVSKAGRRKMDRKSGCLRFAQWGHEPSVTRSCSCHFSILPEVINFSTE